MATRSPASGVRVRLLRPLRDFLHTEAAGGVALVIAAAAALEALRGDAAVQSAPMSKALRRALAQKQVA